jgi:large subunit ribosomal protein L6
MTALAQAAASPTTGIATMVRQSRVGKRPVVLPKGVTFTLEAERFFVKGPKGSLSRAVVPNVLVAQEGSEIRITSSSPGRDGARLQGLMRALLASMVKGVAEGYERGLELVGTGYRCELKGQTVTFQVGLSHPTSIVLPDGVAATVPADSKGTLLMLRSADKAVLGQLAATIRQFRPPEPYGGKGIRYRGEKVRKKAGKAGKGRK